MDIVTQALLGATVGQAGFADRLGRKANWYGALAGVLPDLDVIARPLGDEWQSLIWHRGATHSIWFGPVVGTLLGYGLWRFYERRRRQKTSDSDDGNPLGAWIGLFVLGLLTHPLLDVFTTYGTQLFAPFSDARYSLFAVGVIDPIYTIILVGALLIGWRSRTRPRRAKRAAAVALVCSLCYLAYAVTQRDETRQTASAQLQEAGVKVDALHVYPTLFQPWLRRIVAWSGPYVLVGFHSTLVPSKIHWTRVPHYRAHPQVKALMDSARGQLFRWFANDQLVAKLPAEQSETVRIMDFRYGFVGREQEGMWAIEGKVAKASGDVSQVRRVRNRPKDMRQSLTRMWRALMGNHPPYH
ncbi:MAG: metal-dependent hydrolase [Myxococcota bacterium]|nr:metal-dependent hydrolase [Myxococcota bacterium]